MNKKVKNILLLLCVLFALILSPNYFSYAQTDSVYLGGITAGFNLSARGAYVIGLCDVVGENGVCAPSRNAGIKIGDLILKICGNEVNNASDIEHNVKDIKPLEIEVRRKEENIVFEIIPAKDISGKLKLGLFIRNNVSGIGTITYIKENGDFASLGHPVLNDEAKTLNVLGGDVYLCTVTGCVKGERGSPGELRGIFMRDKIFAKVSRNCATGVYGSMQNCDKSSLKKVKIGRIEQAKVGNITICTNIDGASPKEYSASLVKIDSNNGENKNYVIKITDSNLLESTGGIVQGMSGSPILQDGKIIGAVTHVFINDPTRGFGIDIAKMLND